ncbi:MAG: hypothetical protein IJS39_05945 [Synergistaceae bacterium]|nr:hypothetical protein [Synergistaceae bacterium]
MNIRDKIKLFHEKYQAEYLKHRQENERRFREERRQYWRRQLRILIPLWTILAVELIALWYVKTH